MFKPIIKILGICSFALMLPLTSCDPNHDDEPDSETNPIPNETPETITPEQVRTALSNANFDLCHKSESVDETGTSSYSFRIAPSNTDALNINGTEVIVSKVEFYLDEMLVATKSPYNMGITCQINDYEIPHKLSAYIYGYTSSENETYIPLLIWEYDPETVVITKEDVEAALHSIETVCHHSQSIDELGEIREYMRFECINSTISKIKGKQLILTKAECYVNGELYETRYNDRANSFSFEFISTEIEVHTRQILLYGCTCPENETYITISNKE